MVPKAADQGFAPAQYHLGVMFAYGKGGLQQSDILVLKWWLQTEVINWRSATSGADIATAVVDCLRIMPWRKSGSARLQPKDISRR